MYLADKTEDIRKRMEEIAEQRRQVFVGPVDIAKAWAESLVPDYDPA